MFQSFSFHWLHVCITAMIFNNSWTEHASSNQLVYVDHMLFLMHIYISARNSSKVTMLGKLKSVVYSLVNAQYTFIKLSTNSPTPALDTKSKLNRKGVGRVCRLKRELLQLTLQNTQLEKYFRVWFVFPLTGFEDLLNC